MGRWGGGPRQIGDKPSISLRGRAVPAVRALDIQVEVGASATPCHIPPGGGPVTASIQGRTRFERSMICRLRRVYPFRAAPISTPRSLG